MKFERANSPVREPSLRDRLQESVAGLSGKLFAANMVMSQQKFADTLQIHTTERALAFLETVPSLGELAKVALQVTQFPESFSSPDEDDWDAPDANDAHMYAALPLLYEYVHHPDAPGIVSTAHEVGFGSQMSNCTHCSETVYPATDAYDIIAWQKPEDVTHISYNHNSLDPFPEVAFAPDLQGDVYRLRITQEDTHIMRAHPLSATARTRSDEVIEFAETIEKWDVGNET